MREAEAKTLKHGEWLRVIKPYSRLRPDTILGQLLKVGDYIQYSAKSTDENCVRFFYNDRDGFHIIPFECVERADAAPSTKAGQPLTPADLKTLRQGQWLLVLGNRTHATLPGGKRHVRPGDYVRFEGIYNDDKLAFMYSISPHVIQSMYADEVTIPA